MIYTPDQIDLFKEMKKSPLLFVEKMWNLTVERDNDKFIRGKHISWQQEEILLAIGRGIRGEASPQVSVSSGRGIGKTAVFSWLVLWSLFCYRDAQGAFTAPTSDQIHDILWKEVAKWLQMMKEEHQAQYEWQGDHVRMVASPETWFASARTGRKENPEALAGVHGPFVFLGADEASGVPEQIFKTAEAGLTDPLYIFLMISQYTRRTGFFSDSHGRDKEAWQRFQFSSLDSPLRSDDRIAKIKKKYGENSDEYRIQVLGLPPKDSALDIDGYSFLIDRKIMNITENDDLANERVMGVDIAGEGKNKTVWTVRDSFKIRIVAKEDISNPKQVAQKTITLMTEFDIPDERVVLDGFGVGSKTATEMALAGHKVHCPNVGEDAEDKKRFENIRAEIAWRMREWMSKGGELMQDEEWNEILDVKYQRNKKGKIQLMSKKDMRKAGIASPDIFDSAALTFFVDESQKSEEEEEAEADAAWDDVDNDKVKEVG